MAEFLNLVLNVIHSALSILSLQLTSCVLCTSCTAGWAAKSEVSCDASDLPAVHCFEDTPSISAIVRCISIPSNGCDAVRSRVLLPMWANSVFVHIEVNVDDDRPHTTLELSTT